MKIIEEIRKGSGQDLAFLRAQRLFYHVPRKVADRENIHFTVQPQVVPQCPWRVQRHLHSAQR